MTSTVEKAFNGLLQKIEKTSPFIKDICSILVNGDETPINELEQCINEVSEHYGQKVRTSELVQFWVSQGHIEYWQVSKTHNFSLYSSEIYALETIKKYVEKK